MSVAPYALAALGLAVLMVVHEYGHYWFARRYGMRVTKFSIGFGPTLFRHRPKGSETTYQIAIIPFLAYVQIAGMNPYEEIDPDDKGSYANASLRARFATIFGGPAANYVFASLLMFVGFSIGGRVDVDDTSMRVMVVKEGPAAKAGMKTGDRILEVSGKRISNWDDLKSAVSAHPGKAIDIVYERDGKRMETKTTPTPEGEKHAGKIQVGHYYEIVPVGFGEAALLSLTEPAKVVYGLVRGLGRLIVGKEKAELSGPVGIVKDTAGAVRSGAGDTFKFLGALSASLAGFNLLPIPALDGGRLMFLGFEAASRRRPDAKVEARIHAIGLLMMLTLIAVVTYSDIVTR